MSLGRTLRALAGVALLVACANPAADQALYAQSALVGMPKATLLSCAGVPDRQATADNQEFFTYRSGRITSYPGSVGMWGGHWGPGWGGWGYPVYDVDIRSTTCEATFTLRGGAVERLVYGGAPGGASTLGQCYHVVGNCLAQVPHGAPQVGLQPGPRPAAPAP
ncbi:hypothetical protein [Azospirillum sp. TSO22-1]|uniref:hypothetical protein n=1 Tax=Azospirillum sp. TSO22-1 TaxID=716789 RepID=UPI000D60A237|nr:hypothetical protein [Azospirillum sp. TSO22-1]PWC56408.1 hypothetical protein TSO221_02220 [Azospirillum sp. TSO22-1]